MKAVNLGSMNIDYVYRMDQFIRPGETKACEILTKGCGGKGLNQSIAMAQAGVDTCHAGIIGAEGEFLREKLAEKGVDTRFVRVGEGANGHAIIQVNDAGQNCIILYGGTNRQFSEAYIDDVLSEFESGDIVVLQNEINNIPYIIERAYEKGLRVAFNAAPYDDSILAYPLDKVEWLIVNEVEGGALSGESDPGAIADKLLAMYPRTKLMLTLGKDGCLYADSTQRVQMGACTVEAVDTTAAGDTFIGYFIKGMTENLSIEQALRLATVASAIAVTRPGAADSVPAYEEVIHSPLLEAL